MKLTGREERNRNADAMPALSPKARLDFYLLGPIDSGLRFRYVTSGLH